MMVLCYLKISKRPHRTCIPESYCGRHDLLLCNKIVNQLEKVDVFLYSMGAPRFRLLPVAPTYRLGESFEWACSKGISPGYRSRRHSSAEIRGKFAYFVWPPTRHNWQGNPGCLDVSWFSCTFARLFSGATKGNHCVASLLEFNRFPCLLACRETLTKHRNTAVAVKSKQGDELHVLHATWFFFSNLFRTLSLAS